MGKRQSQSWKKAEAQLAKLIGGRRVLRGSDFSKSDVDAIADDLPFLKCDAKYRVSHAHHSLMEEIQEKYCKAEVDEPVLFTKHHNQSGGYITIRGEFFSSLLNAWRELNVDEDLGNVSAAKLLTVKDKTKSIPLFTRQVCSNCTLDEGECRCCHMNCSCESCR